MSLSRDRENVEVRCLIHKDDMTLDALREVLQVAQSVIGLDLYDMFSKCKNVFYLNHANMCLRDACDKYLQGNLRHWWGLP